MCTDKVLYVKKLYKELDARERRQVLNAVLWDAVRANNTHYNYINNYINNNCVGINARANARGKHDNVFIGDEGYNKFVTEFGQDFTNRIIDQMSDKIKAGYMSKDHAVTFRSFAEAQKRFDTRHTPAKSTKEFIRHNYSPEIFKERNNDEIEF